MVGFLFNVCIPTSEYESTLKESSQGKNASTGTVSEDCTKQFSDRNPESLRSVRESNSAADSFYETDGTSTSNLSTTPKESEPIINSDITLDRNNENQTLTDSRSDGPCEVAIEIDETGSKEEVTEVGVKKNGSERIKEESESVMSMEKVLEMVIKKFEIENDVWCPVKSGRYYKVSFDVGSGDCCEEILRHLNEAGIGVILNSVVSIIPCTLHYEGKQQSLVEECPSEEEIDENKQKSVKPSAWDKFMMSVRSRLTVAQVEEDVRAEASLTFDFLAQLVIAGVVAATGLGENSTINLVASMLISPLMGPIMAGTFGTVIENRHLQKMGVLNELFGLLVCLLVGFIFGLTAGWANENWGNGGWPTDLMMARGKLQSLWVGLLVAVPSGAAVAIGILRGNISSLVGAAISASLLPPAVNAGLLWALAFMDVLWPGHTRLAVHDAGEKNIYLDDPRLELLIMGAVSLLLALINIISIFLAGIVVLKIKEVAPRTSKDQMQFWKHDIKIARDYNRTFHGEDAEEIRKRLAEDVARTKLHSPNLYNLGHHEALFGSHEPFNPFARSALRSQLTWSPSTMGFSEEGRPPLYDVHKTYTSISTSTGQGNIDVQPFQRKRRRHSGGAFWFGENQVNDAACNTSVDIPQTVDPSGSAVTVLPTITENKTQHEIDSDLNEGLHTSLPSREVSSSEMPYNAKKIFTVTAAKDPIEDDQ